MLEREIKGRERVSKLVFINPAPIVAECGGKKGRLFSEIDEGGEPLPLLEISSFLSTGELPAAAVLNNGKDSFGRDIRSCGDRPGNDDSKLKGS